jgi:hypothetical protein
MQSRNPDLATTSSNILRRQHSCVRRRLVTIGFDFHTASDTGDGFLAREIGDMDECIVERGKDVGDGEDAFTFGDLGTERYGVFFADYFSFFWGLWDGVSVEFDIGLVRSESSSLQPANPSFLPLLSSQTVSLLRFCLSYSLSSVLGLTILECLDEGSG